MSVPTNNPNDAVTKLIAFVKTVLWPLLWPYVQEGYTSIKGYLNLTEFIKVVVAFATTGGGLGGLLRLLLTNLPQIVTNPGLLGILQWVLPLVIAVVGGGTAAAVSLKRQMGHGVSPRPALAARIRD